MENGTIELKVPARPEYVGVVRLLISGVASREGFSYEAIEDMKVAVAEACTNAVNHAYNGEEGTIKLECSTYDDRLEIKVIDYGKSFSFSDVEHRLGPVDQSTPVDHMYEGGLGLFLIETLMDHVQINNEQGIVIMMTKFKQDEVEFDDRPIQTSPSR